MIHVADTHAHAPIHAHAREDTRARTNTRTVAHAREHTCIQRMRAITQVMNEGIKKNRRISVIRTRRGSDM